VGTGNERHLEKLLLWQYIYVLYMITVTGFWESLEFGLVLGLVT